MSPNMNVERSIQSIQLAEWRAIVFHLVPPSDKARIRSSQPAMRVPEESVESILIDENSGPPTGTHCAEACTMGKNTTNALSATRRISLVIPLLVEAITVPFVKNIERGGRERAVVTLLQQIHLPAFHELPRLPVICLSCL